MLVICVSSVRIDEREFAKRSSFHRENMKAQSRARGG